MKFTLKVTDESPPAEQGQYHLDREFDGQPSEIMTGIINAMIFEERYVMLFQEIVNLANKQGNGNLRQALATIREK